MSRSDPSHPLPEPAPLAVDDAVRSRFAPFFASSRGRSGRFHNPWPFEARRSLRDLLAWQRSSPSRSEKRARRRAAPGFSETALGDYAALSSRARLLWLGHASFFVQIDGTTVAIDPVLGRVARVMARLCPQPHSPRELPAPDVILLTHGHYDHLDAPSVRALYEHAGGAALVVTPKGLGRCLPATCRRVVELDWWHHVEVGSLRITLVPSQHWHRRRIGDLDRALWGGFVIQGERSVYHSGDTGFFGGFEAIGAAMGATIDLACLPLGAYEPRWFMGSQHMAPEESLQALLDLRARHLVGMHWGTFDLTDEPVDAGPGLLMEHLGRRGIDRGRVHVLTPGGAIGFEEDVLRVHGRLSETSAR